MKKIKFILASIFIALSLLTWLQDTRWFTSTEDVVPLFMSFAFFMWLAEPWKTGEVMQKPSALIPIMSFTFLLFAFIFNSTLLFACCTCCIAWLWFDIFFQGENKHDLIVFLFLSFPWIALSADKIGWIFRLSGATFAYKIFTTLGFPTQQQGTSLIVSGVYLSVDTACAGMSTLQAVLIMGFAVMYMYLQEKMNVALNLFILTLLAWWTNALRIVIIGFAALIAGEEFALGLFHTWGSMMLLMFMFGFTFLIAYLQKKWAKFCNEKVIVIVAFLYILLNLGTLFSGWWRSPLEKYGWLVLIVWLMPSLYQVYKNRSLQNNHLLLSLAIVTTFIGAIGDLNTLCYLGFAGFIYSFAVQISWQNLLWGASAVTWMPAFSWFASYYVSNYVILLKLTIVIATSFLAITNPGRNIKIKLKLPQIAAAYSILFILAFVWPFLSHREDQRLQNIPSAGFGFVGQNIELTKRERGSFGKANVLKRFYRVGTQAFVLMAIDGTNDRHAVHDPNYCIVGAGWKIAFTKQLTGNNGTMRLVKLRRGQETKEVVYWFSAQFSTYTSPTRYWYETTMRRISLGYMYQEPLLIILQTVDGKSLDWNKVFDLMPQIQEL